MTKNQALLLLCVIPDFHRRQGYGGQADPGSRNSTQAFVMSSKSSRRIWIWEPSFSRIYGTLLIFHYGIPDRIPCVHLSGMTAGTGCYSCNNTLMQKANRDSPYHLICPIRHLRPYRDTAHKLSIWKKELPQNPQLATRNPN